MAKRFERTLDAATEQTLVEPNWEGILECVDMIRGADVPVNDAILLIQKRYHSSNPHVAHHALLVLEACVKNCGKKFHMEVATREFMDDLKNLVIGGTTDKVKEKVLELIQCWASAFRERTEYKIVVDTHNLLKMNGFEFPVMKEADAMFMADSAPDWVEGDNCYRCRAEFGMFTRKHHCRACGQIFCDKCSNKQMLLPQFGIEKRVRVCESCFDRKMNQKTASTSETGLKHRFIHAYPVHKMPKLNWKQFLFGESPVQEHRIRRFQGEDETRERARLQELMQKEAEELELALAISQSEAEAKERQNRGGYSSSYSNYLNSNGGCSSTLKVDGDSEKFNQGTDIYRGAASNVEETVANKMENEEPLMDSVLAKYLDREYWERKRSGKETEIMGPRATAPPPSEYSMSIASNDQQNASYLDATLAQRESDSNINGGLNGVAESFEKLNFGKQVVGDDAEDVAETAQFCKALKDQVDTMDNRMRSNLLRGRSIINDSAIHSLFAQLTNSHANVLARMTKLEGDREYYETLQDHLAHIQEARQAVNALRDEHMRQKEARILEEQQQRRAQMQHALGVMRQMKHKTLLYERHLALQRFQEQEQQMQQRRFIYHQQQQQGVMHQPGYYQQAVPMSNNNGMSIATSPAQALQNQDALMYQKHLEYKRYQEQEAQMPHQQMYQSTPPISQIQQSQHQPSMPQQVGAYYSQSLGFPMNNNGSTTTALSSLPSQSQQTYYHPSPTPVSIPQQQQTNFNMTQQQLPPHQQQQQPVVQPQHAPPQPNHVPEDLLISFD